MFKDKELKARVTNLATDVTNNLSELEELRFRFNTFERSTLEQVAKLNRLLHVQLAEQQVHINTLAQTTDMMLKYFNVEIVKEYVCLKPVILNNPIKNGSTT